MGLLVLVHAAMEIQLGCTAVLTRGIAHCGQVRKGHAHHEEGGRASVALVARSEVEEASREEAIEHEGAQDAILEAAGQNVGRNGSISLKIRSCTPFLVLVQRSLGTVRLEVLIGVQFLGKIVVLHQAVDLLLELGELVISH